MALLDGLDNEQKKAVTLETNGVIAAGAGSGKTKVLASRYAWLVTEKKLKSEEILTLTFTNKAVSEMYSRIYQYLGESDDAALKDFYKARISTLDSFSAGVAKTAAARYGISPDFKSDDAALKDLSREAALGFVLDNRENPALRALLVDHKIRALAEEIFAQVVLQYSPISSPLDFTANLSAQKETILKTWNEKTRLTEEITGHIIKELHALASQKISGKLTKTLGAILLEGPAPELPDISPLLETDASPGGGTGVDIDWDAELPPSETRLQIKKYFDYYSVLVSTSLQGKFGEAYKPLIEYFRQLKGKDKDGLYYELGAIANYAFNFGLCSGIFALVKKFQDEFNNKKRETGFLSFNDIAHLAVDALKEHPDIRKVYKDSFKMIMIDEFQDNNALQRDLVYLLAEKPGRTEKGIAPAEELEKNRMFFVGDEKQSIYRFRGADVAVFRSLDRTMGSGESFGLIHNYRSRPGLIAAFNRIFGEVFMPPLSGAPDYEAVYSPILPPEPCAGEGENRRPGENPRDKNPCEENPLAHFCFLNEEALPDDDTGGIKSHDLEAVFIAGKIRDMVANKEKIAKRSGKGTEWAECTWGDFAVLERSYTHQNTLEKYFREFGIPYNTGRPAGLFNEAPILDLRAFLRLVVYPDDRVAYAALIRSPFMRLNDLSLAVCMLGPYKNAEPFAEENEEFIQKEELELYRRARERYCSIREASRSLSITELVTKLWFEEGYRYETLWTESAQVYESLFDLFFSLASEADSRGKSLAEFIDYLDAVMNREVKPDEKDIPGEGERGVRILSIHKSKGLEFPVVFIFNCAHSVNTASSGGLVGYHEKYGLILNIPQAVELPIGGNYFSKIMQEEEKAKDAAELKRLLYVAMTRAESRLFLTFTLPGQTKKEKEDWDAEEEEFNEETIRRRLVQLAGKDGNSETFLTLLESCLPGCPSALCSIETIPVLTRAEILNYANHSSYDSHSNDSHSSYSKLNIADGWVKQKASQREAALAAAPFYENAEILPEGKAAPVSLDASKLIVTKDLSLIGAKKVIDTFLEDEGKKVIDTWLSPADFGTLVHAVLEGRLNERPCVLPAKIRSRPPEKAVQEMIASAEGMADAFIASDLGKRWAASGSRETEYPVVTSINIEGKAVAVMGQIDLLFEEDGRMVVADFKTDRKMNPKDHFCQLAAYYRAVGDIFGKDVSVWLCYLCFPPETGFIDVTDEVKQILLDNP